MAIRGAAKDRIIAALSRRQQFNFNSNAMSAIEGKGETGRMEGDDLARYQADDVAYTVYSYATPIAWVTRTGLIRISSTGYSNTTRQHISLCRVYL